MKRKVLFPLALFVASTFLLQQNTIAQKKGEGSSYTNAAGMRIELGSDFGTLVGFSFKHFFSEHAAGEMQLLFGRNNSIILEPEIQYHGDIANAEGLKWYVGFGPGFAFASGGESDVLLRPMVGLDYKIKQVPLNFAFDWRPSFAVTHGSHFTPARFGIVLRYAF